MRIRWLRCLAAVVSVAIACSLGLGGQMRVVPLDMEEGRVALGLALRRLSNTGIFMHATAHPDDEDNGLLVMLSRGLGYRTVLATATRGNGGQNEIGPEIFEALGVLRTEELAAIHRFDGAEQYFTRAVDFGYSFSLEETFEKWGRQEIVGDFVRLIRTIRPDVILSLDPNGDGGGQHHQASAVLVREAYGLAADPTKYPEQLEEGLRPWQASKFYIPVGGFGGRGGARPAAGEPVVTVNLGTYDRLLGRTYAEIGTEARSMHKCQGMGQLLALPGPASSAFQLADAARGLSRQAQEASLFDGIDTTIGGLARFAGSPPTRLLTQGLATISSTLADAERAFDAAGNADVVAPLLRGLTAVRQLRAGLGAMNIPQEGRWEIEQRLRQKEREFQRAIVLAAHLRVEALADDGVVVPGQSVNVSVVVANRGAADVSVRRVTFDGFSSDPACDLRAVREGQFGGRGFAGPGGGRGGAGRGRGGREDEPGPVISTLGPNQTASCEPELSVPIDARVSEPYWHREGEAGRYSFDPDAPFGLPYRPTTFYVQVALRFGGNEEEVYYGLPVVHRYQGDVFSGEKRTELLVAPPLSVRVSPDVAIVPVASAGGDSDREREIRVTVTNNDPRAVETTVALGLPDGWTSAPASVRVALDREDGSETVRFRVRPPSESGPGEYELAAAAASDSGVADRGFQVIEYPHIRRQHVYYPARTRVNIVDVRVRPGLRVGYVMGTGDEVPAAILQLGARLEMLDADDLAWGDLSVYDAIVTGVRAYERRGDLRTSNGRLLEYVRQGGRLIVQYNRFDFNSAQYGPYPAEVSSDRVTAEDAPVRILLPKDPIFTTPNQIGEAAWRGWVQERGLYFLGDRDPRYRDLVSLEDTFPSNPGEKRGALVVADYGKGRWIYVGLGLWRELPAGVAGAYQLLANLISPS